MTDEKTIDLLAEKIAARLDENRLFRKREICKEYHVSIDTVNNWICEGLPVIIAGERQKFIVKKDLLKFLETKKQTL